MVTFPGERPFCEEDQYEPWKTSRSEKQQDTLETQKNQVVGCPGNEEETMSPTPQLRMVSNSMCKLILKTRPGEGPWDPELYQLESDQVSFWRGGWWASQRCKTPDLRSPDAEVLQARKPEKECRIIIRKRSCRGDHEGTNGRTKANSVGMAREQVERICVLDSTEPLS